MNMVNSLYIPKQTDCVPNANSGGHMEELQ